jgi:hypothetical protein
VADATNNRVLHFPAGSVTADRVYGQGATGTSFATKAATTSATGMFGPTGVAVDSSGGIYVADFSNDRVLHFPAGSVTADRVYGQGATGTSFTTAASGTSATAMNAPFGVAVDGSGGLYVADDLNNRVLHFPAGSVTADLVYGQGSSGTSFTSKASGTSATAMFRPFGVAVVGSSGLFVADENNNRVLYFGPPSCGTPVFGTSGGHTTVTITVADNVPGLAASTASPPGIVASTLVNATFTTNPASWSAGATSVNAIATKTNQAIPARVALTLTDAQGNTVQCDPVFTTLVRGDGQGRNQILTGVAATDHLLHIANGDPGIGRLLVLVNHRWVRLLALAPNEQTTLDLAAGLHPGDTNTVTLLVIGPSRGSASVALADS